jgi:hypothetical protein
LFSFATLWRHEMWVGVQDMHPKTLNLCIVVDHSPKKPSIVTLFCDMLEEIMECGTRPLHLKIAAWHEERKRHGDNMPFDWTI